MGGVEDTLRAEGDSARRVVSKSTHFGVLPFIFVIEYFGLID